MATRTQSLTARAPRSAARLAWAGALAAAVATAEPSC